MLRSGWVFVVVVIGCGGDPSAPADAATDEGLADAAICAPCRNGAACAVDGDCLSGRCESGVCTSPVGTHPDIVRVIEVAGRDPGAGWSDSYSVGDQCYCASTFDHAIGELVMTTPAGPRTVREICDALGPGPGTEGRPVYNDIQCGNGPANDAGDEDDCPGRVDLGREGCGHIGPTWDLDVLAR